VNLTDPATLVHRRFPRVDVSLLRLKSILSCIGLKAGTRSVPGVIKAACYLT
jgi:hypothetical protein